MSKKHVYIIKTSPKLLQEEEAKSDYLGQLFVTPEMVAKKIKATKDNKSPALELNSFKTNY